MAWTTSLSTPSFQYRPSFTAPRQAFASHGTADPMRQLEMQDNCMYKIPAAGARLIGSLPYLAPSIEIARYSGLCADKASAIKVGVIEADGNSPGTQTSDEAILKREGTFIAHQT